MWSKGKRFRYAEEREEVLNFNSYTDYIRKQFLISNSLLNRAGDVRMEASMMSGSPNKKKGRKSKANRQVSPEWSPNGAPTAESPKQSNNHAEEVPESNERNVEARMKMILGAYGRSKSMSSLHNKVTPDSSASPMLALSPPGPATYHKPSSFVKPTFNRMFSDPNNGQDHNSRAAHSNHHNEGGGASPARTFAPLTGGDGRHSSTFAGSPAGGMFLKVKRTKSADVKCKVNSNNVGKRPPSPSKGFAPKSSPSKAMSVSAQNPALLHQRYPPLSDNLMKRWTSTSRDTFKKWSPAERGRPTSPTARRHH